MVQRYIWLWAAIEPKNRQILALDISRERNMIIAERFVEGLWVSRNDNLPQLL